jgi:hypothetical protein
VATNKRNNKSRHNNETIINHAFVNSCKGDTDVEEDGDDKDDLDEDVDLFEEKRFEKTKPTNWMNHANGQLERVIHPIPFTEPEEFFCPNISDKELMGVIDAHAVYTFPKSMSGCYQCLAAILFMIFIGEDAIVLPTGRSSLLTTLCAFLDANLCRV